MVLILTETDVQSILDIGDAIEAVEGAFIEIGRGTAIAPARPNLYLPKYDGNLLLNCGYLHASDSVGVKIASSYAGNARLGLPTVTALIALYDARSGALLSLMGGTYITAMKTGASGAVAAKYLVGANPVTAGIIGTGIQGETQVWGLTKVTGLKRVVAYDLDEERKSRFCEKVSKKFGVQALPANSSEAVLRQADILVTATTSRNPVFSGKFLKEGTHVNAIGSFTDARELDEETIRTAKTVYVDNEEALAVGDLKVPLDAGSLRKENVVHLAEVIGGRRPGRTHDKQVTVFKSVGGAPYDIAVAAKTFQLAKARRVGKDVEL